MLELASLAPSARRADARRVRASVVAFGARTEFRSRPAAESARARRARRIVDAVCALFSSLLAESLNLNFSSIWNACKARKRSPTAPHTHLAAF